jgi:hypothetical protein
MLLRERQKAPGTTKFVPGAFFVGIGSSLCGKLVQPNNELL